MNIEKIITENKAEFKPEGWLDTKTAPEFAEALAQLPEDVTELTINLEKLEYISSAGLRQIVSAHKKMKGALTVINVPQPILDVFSMTGFDSKLNIK